MTITPYADVDQLLHKLLAQMQQILDNKLIGLYLYGSLITGDFDRNRSDIDLLAVLAADITDDEFDQLQQMHDDLVKQDTRWDNRIEVAYLTIAALETYKSHISTIAMISPGEPFHRKEAGREYLLNWHKVRERGIVLFGPSPKTIITPSTKEEFLQVVREHARAWREWVADAQSLPAQAYAILTLCRAWYADRSGEQVSKKKAAQWAEQQAPEWAPLIRKALLWREGWRDTEETEELVYPETVRFVNFVIDQIEQKE
jgi:predicted nucleotidyltransferase